MKKTIKFKNISKIQIKNPKVNNKIKNPKVNNKIKYTSLDHFAIPINNNIINDINSNNNSNKTIIHIYDSNYMRGFGDFIRGSILLAQYAKYHNINFKINTTRHIISNYLNNEAELISTDINIYVLDSKINGKYIKKKL